MIRRHFNWHLFFLFVIPLDIDLHFGNSIPIHFDRTENGKRNFMFGAMAAQKLFSRQKCKTYSMNRKSRALFAILWDNFSFNFFTRNFIISSSVNLNSRMKNTMNLCHTTSFGLFPSLYVNLKTLTKTLSWCFHRHYEWIEWNIIKVFGQNVKYIL